MSLFRITQGMVNGLRDVARGDSVRNVRTYGILWDIGLIEPPEHLRDETTLTPEGRAVLDAAEEFERLVTTALASALTKKGSAER